MQPHMIVPSQARLGSYTEELRRRELPVKIPTRNPSTRMMSRLPFQDSLLNDPASSSPVIAAVAASVPQVTEQSRNEPHRDSQMSGQMTVYPAHDLHPVPVGLVSSPVSLIDSDNEHSHSYLRSPKAEQRNKRSPTSRASSAGSRLSPQPQNQKVATDGDKKLYLACLFCRGRKIACGPPLPGSTDQSCK